MGNDLQRVSNEDCIEVIDHGRTVSWHEEFIGTTFQLVFGSLLFVDLRHDLNTLVNFRIFVCCSCMQYHWGVVNVFKSFDEPSEGIDPSNTIGASIWTFGCILTRGCRRRSSIDVTLIIGSAPFLGSLGSVHFQVKLMMLGLLAELPVKKGVTKNRVACATIFQSVDV